MNTHEFAQAIKTRMHPEPYGNDVQSCDPFDFLIMRRSALIGGRYAFAFRRLGDAGVGETFEQARVQARRLCKSMWLLREVGLYLMLCGPESSWREQVELAQVDQTGFHNIIVQCVHFVDPETGADHLNRASWGPVKFGGLIPIPDMVGEVIREIPKS